MEDEGRRTFLGKEQRRYVGYEYKEILADSPMLSLLLDGYGALGWEIDQNLPEGSMGRGPGGRGRMGGTAKTVIRMKRDRKIVNKTELTRLQRNFEACVDEIQVLEKRKTSVATVYALILGVIGTAFMAGSTFAVTAQPPHILLCILLAVPGFCGWIFPCFLYQMVRRKQTEKLIPLIEAKYEEIDGICAKGDKLLA